MSEQQLEAEAHAIETIFNEAAPDYSPDLEWFGMTVDHETEERSFVFESFGYIDTGGLTALRECGRKVRYIEAYEYGDEVSVQIELRVHGEIPESPNSSRGDN